jgi:hypothetical protein
MTLLNFIFTQKLILYFVLITVCIIGKHLNRYKNIELGRLKICSAYSMEIAR